MSRPDVQPKLDSAAVLTRATLRAADKLGLSQRDLAKLLGVSAASMSRLSRGRTIDPSGKEGELALLFLRLFRSLDALVGGDESAANAWFHAKNLHLEGVPAELVARVDGLVHVVEYLDAMRGRL
jgi:transcriptional regulator with XRE-family HTH domain